jgi:predicted ATPase
MKKHKDSTSNKKSIANEKQISADRQILNKKNQEFERRKIYTEREASAYLRLSLVTLWRLRKAGKINFHRFNSKIIYTSDDLENYLESTKRNAFGITEVCDEK